MLLSNFEISYYVTVKNSGVSAYNLNPVQLNRMLIETIDRFGKDRVEIGYQVKEKTNDKETKT